MTIFPFSKSGKQKKIRLQFTVILGKI